MLYNTESPLDSDITEAKWGNITGNLIDQSDLHAALSLKANASDIPDTSDVLTKTEASSMYLGISAKAASASQADSATKATQDASGNTITATYATKSELAQKQPLGSYVNKTDYDAFVGQYAIDKDTFALKADISTVYKYKGTVADINALPAKKKQVGDVYNLEDTGDNVAWDGNSWDYLGGTANLSEYAKTSDVDSSIASAKAELNTTFNTALKGKLDATANAVSATKATQDASGNIITSTYATKAEVTQGLAGKAPMSHTHTIANVTGLQVDLTAIRESITNVSSKVDGIGDTLSPTYAKKQGILDACDKALNGANPVHAGDPTLDEIKLALATIQAQLGQLESRRYVKETGKSSDGTSWYRKWSDGWIEQGGIVELSTTDYGGVTILLPTAMTTDTYNVSIQCNKGDWDFDSRVDAKSRTDFVVSSRFSKNFYWTILGF